MADRAPATIAIGGKVNADQFAELTRMIVAHGLSTEWDDPAFTAEHRVAGQALALYAHEVAWGVFEDLEQYCCDNIIPYTLWSGGCAGSFGPGRIVYDGKSGPLSYAATDDGEIVLHASTIEQLATIRHIRAYLKPAEYVVPPLIVLC
jgi:hypothetical protein